MFDNVFKALKKIFSNEELINKIEKLDDWDEIYQEFVQITPECKEFEFYRFLLFLSECITGKKIRIPISYEGLTSEENIDEISGGGNWITRTAAATLALSTAFAGGAGGFFRDAAGATDLPQTAVLRPKRSKNYQQTEITEEAKKTFLTRVKDSLKSFGKKIWDNKGKLLLAGGLALGAVALSKYGYGTYQLRKQRMSLNAALNGIGDEENDTYNGEEYVRTPGDLHGKKKEDLEKLVTDNTRRLTEYSIFSGTPLRSMGVLMGTLGGMWTAGMSFLDLLGRIGENFKKTGEGVEKIQSAVRTAERAAKEAQSRINERPYDSAESYENMLEELKMVKGQEEAKRQVKSFYHRVISDRERAEYTGKKNTAKVIVFNGPSGCGKSMTAGILSRALTNGSTYTMSASEVDPKSGQTIAQQLFAKNSWSWGDDGDESFSSYIKKHRGDGVVVINEYDKMYTPKGNSPHELDEVMRTWMDEGKANLYGRDYDCSGITFILTTNESDGSLKGEVKADAYGNLTDPSVEDDTTRSLTSVVHDKSFLNRLTVVGFDNLTAEEYTAVAKQNFEETLEFLSSEFGDFTDVEIDYDSYRRMGMCLAAINEGARPVEKFIAELFVNIVDAKNELREKGIDVTGLTFKADFDYSGRDFRFDVKLVEDEETLQEEETLEEEELELHEDSTERLQKLEEESEENTDTEEQ